jgi:hypothetical protein
MTSYLKTISAATLALAVAFGFAMTPGVAGSAAYAADHGKDGGHDKGSRDKGSQDKGSADKGSKGDDSRDSSGDQSSDRGDN